jgi:ABC-type nickel/cobalt efflux system permease component RcnA
VRTARRLAALTALGFALLAVVAGGASAHPLGNFTINTYDGIVVVPGGVRVNYVVDMAEIPTVQLGRTLDAGGDGTTTPAELAAFALDRSAELPPSIDLTVDGRPVALAVRSAHASFRPGQAGLRTLRLEVVLTAAIGRAGTLTFSDATYADHVGWHEVTAVGARGAVVAGSTVPTASISDVLLRYPKHLLQSPLDVTTARLSFEPGTSGAAPGLPEGSGSANGEEVRPGVTGGAFARLATWTGLSVPALLLALLLAMAFGAGHALLPGHGKTLIAAYLVGQGGRMRQAAQVGISVAFMHTASVLVLGLAILGLELVAPDRVYPWVTLATGLLVVGMGAALLVIRLRDARRGRVAHGHHHHHGHDHHEDEESHDPEGEFEMELGAHEHEAVDARIPVLAGVGVGAAGPATAIPVAHSLPASSNGHRGPVPNGHSHAGHSHTAERPVLDRPLSRKGLAGLAVAGGILPSPTAIVVLLATFSAHRVGFGLALIAAFSLGMAGALIAVGFVAVRARTAVSKRLSGRLVWALPIVTAIVIAGLGVYLTIRGAAGI